MRPDLTKVPPRISGHRTSCQQPKALTNDPPERITRPVKTGCPYLDRQPDNHADTTKNGSAEKTERKDKNQGRGSQMEYNEMHKACAMHSMGGCFHPIPWINNEQDCSTNFIASKLKINISFKQSRNNMLIKEARAYNFVTPYHPLVFTP